MNRAQWNKLADDFELDVCDISREETDNQIRRYVPAAAKLKKNPVLVDLGCGIGSFIKMFGAPFREIIGVEFAPRIIARAKKRCARMPGITWLTMDIPRSAKEIGRRADLTVCMNVITSPSAAKRKALWATIRSVTKRGGFALVVVPSLESQLMVEHVERGGKPAATLPKGGLMTRAEAVQKHFERDELNAVMTREGFKVKRIGRARYPWGKEGMIETKGRAANRPWDWVCLAQRV